jgi:hypothetical protein
MPKNSKVPQGSVGIHCCMVWSFAEHGPLSGGPHLHRCHSGRRPARFELERCIS